MLTGEVVDDGASEADIVMLVVGYGEAPVESVAVRVGEGVFVDVGNGVEGFDGVGLTSLHQSRVTCCRVVNRKLYSRVERCVGKSSIDLPIWRGKCGKKSESI
jgi:hypothetical protein